MSKRKAWIKRTLKKQYVKMLSNALQKSFVCMIYYLHVNCKPVIKLYVHDTRTLTNVQIIFSGLFVSIYFPLKSFLKFPQDWLSTFILQILCFCYPTVRQGNLGESVCNIVWCSSKGISYKISSFNWTF